MDPTSRTRGLACEVENARDSLAGADDKLAQVDRRTPEATISLGIPTTRSGDLNSDAHREEPGRDLSTWTLDQLQSFIADARGRQLEVARVVAQEQAYNACHPQETRRQWAKQSLLANRRILDNAKGSPARALQQDFMLRMWVIDRLGPDDTDPDWSPEALASDTLEVLTFTPQLAAGLAADWRNLPIGQIRELRQHKNLTAHLERLASHLASGPVRDRLVAWTAARPLLP